MTKTIQSKNTGTHMFSSGDIVSDMSPSYSFSKGEGDAEVLTVGNVAVFRSGTFRDSSGYQKAFTEFDIHAMVSNFDLLRQTGHFVNVPVRDGHPGFGSMGGSTADGRVVGWHTGLRAETRTCVTDGQEYTYLIAEYEIIDEAAQKNILSGLWRNRSAEISPYYDNNDTEHYPVYHGVAFVDIPAVEGLNQFSASQTAGSTLILEKENSMSTATPESQAPAIPALPATVEPPVVEAPAAEPEAPAGTFAAPAAGQQHMFTMNGSKSSDFAAVQAHINALEAFRTESLEAARSNFVKSLADSNKIPATQVESMTAFVKGLAPEAYDQYKAMMEATPEMGIFGSYAAPAPTATGAAAIAADQRSTLVDVVQNHKRSGLPVDQIKATGSYKQLVALDPTFKL